MECLDFVSNSKSISLIYLWAENFCFYLISMVMFNSCANKLSLLRFSHLFPFRYKNIFTQQVAYEISPTPPPPSPIPFPQVFSHFSHPK